MSSSQAKMRQYCLVLDLKDDAELIEEYELHHQNGKVWPEVIDSIRHSGIVDMKIFRFQDRLVMLMEVNEGFSFDRKAKMDKNNDKVQAWEALMNRFQKPLTDNESEKWQLTKCIFELNP